MKNPDNTELAGRIEAIGRALLRLTAQLEMAQLIDGPHVSQAWRQAVTERRAADSAVLLGARHCLHDMAAQLDDARQAREAPSHDQ